MAVSSDSAAIIPSPEPIHDEGKAEEPLGKSDYSPISSRAIGGGAQHPFVKNHVNDTEFDIARDPRFAAAFRLRPESETPLPRGFILFGGAAETAEAAAGGGAP